jgi:ubiquinone/menaquinone biosynthesis C-methylase UbiE
MRNFRQPAHNVNIHQTSTASFRQSYSTATANSYSAYTLWVGKQAEERLDILNQIYNQDSKVFLHKAGLKSAKAVLDVGCGTGELACWMAKEITPESTVFALDYSSNQLEVAKENARRSSITNIEFIHMSAYDLPKLHRTFDFVNTRFLLAHLDQPEQVLNAMVEVLSPGGILACEEAKTSGHYCNPPSNDFNKYLDTWTRLRIAKGADPDFGLKLPGLFNSLKMQNVEYHLCEHDLNSKEERRIFELNIKECAEPAISAHLASREELVSLRGSLMKLGDEDPNKRTLRFSSSVQVWGQKPHFFKSCVTAATSTDVHANRNNSPNHGTANHHIRSNL